MERDQALLLALQGKLTRKNKPLQFLGFVIRLSLTGASGQVHRINFFMISKILQSGSKIVEFKASFEPLNSQSKLRTPGYQPSAEEFC